MKADILGPVKGFIAPLYLYNPQKIQCKLIPKPELKKMSKSVYCLKLDNIYDVSPCIVKVKSKTKPQLNLTFKSAKYIISASKLKLFNTSQLIFFLKKP